MKNKEREKKHRQKNINNNDHIQVQNRVAFNSPQSHGKGNKKVTQCLPNSPRKRTAVIAALAHVKTRKLDNPGIHSIDKEVADKVTNFYLVSSWICPGQKDVVIIRKPGEKKTKLQKPYLLTTLKEDHAMFLEENPTCIISFSKLADLRPPQVLLQRDVPHNACLCKYHENVRLLLQALNKGGLDVSTSFRHFIALNVCDQSNQKCRDGTCENCP